MQRSQKLHSPINMIDFPLFEARLNMSHIYDQKGTRNSCNDSVQVKRFLGIGIKYANKYGLCETELKSTL